MKPKIHTQSPSADWAGKPIRKLSRKLQEKMADLEAGRRVLIPENQRSKDLEYYYRNKEKIKERRMSRYDPSKAKEKNQENYRKNRDKILEYKKRYSLANRTKILIRSRVYRASRRDKIREYHLRKKFNLTPKEYNEMLKRQGGGCKICGDKPTEHRHLCVDHCHDSGEVRGILCDLCNSGLGKFKDDPKLLEEAMKYILSHHDSNS